jgi:hypothetical protein
MGCSVPHLGCIRRPLHAGGCTCTAHTHHRHLPTHVDWSARRKDGRSPDEHAAGGCTCSRCGRAAGSETVANVLAHGIRGCRPWQLTARSLLLPSQATSMQTRLQRCMHGMHAQHVGHQGMLNSTLRYLVLTATSALASGSRANGGKALATSEGESLTALLGPSRQHSRRPQPLCTVMAMLLPGSCCPPVVIAHQVHVAGPFVLGLTAIHGPAMPRQKVLSPTDRAQVAWRPGDVHRSPGDRAQVAWRPGRQVHDEGHGQSEVRSPRLCRGFQLPGSLRSAGPLTPYTLSHAQTWRTAWPEGLALLACQRQQTAQAGRGQWWQGQQLRVSRQGHMRAAPKQVYAYPLQQFKPTTCPTN